MSNTAKNDSGPVIKVTELLSGLWSVLTEEDGLSSSANM